MRSFRDKWAYINILWKYMIIQYIDIFQHCGDDVQWQVLQGDLSINEGALTENFVATELVKHGHLLHYYDHKSRNELDFLLQEKNRLSILEVKSGNDYKRHSSLTNALNNESNKIGRSMVLNKFNVEKTESITYIPLYMAAFV